MTGNELIYEKKILIRSEQVDMTRTLRISELFRIMEEASIAHTEELGCTRHKTLDRGLLWIITRQSVEISELPCYDDEITVKSWQGEMMHVFFPRIYEIWKKDRCIIRGQALWMLINNDTRDMVMPEDYDINIPGLPDSEDVMIPALRIPSDIGGPEFCYPVRTRFSQVDINGHMNNTRYFDLIDDAMESYDPGCISEAKPHSITANYLSELRSGDEFDLTGYKKSGTWYYQGAAEKIKFLIRVTY